LTQHLLLAGEWSALHSHVMKRVAPRYVLASAGEDEAAELDERSELAIVLGAMAEHSDAIVGWRRGGGALLAYLAAARDAAQWRRRVAADAVGLHGVAELRDAAARAAHASNALARLECGHDGGDDDDDDGAAAGDASGAACRAELAGRLATHLLHVRALLCAVASGGDGAMAIGGDLLGVCAPLRALPVPPDYRLSACHALLSAYHQLTPDDDELLCV
jgi:hypothetical protein